MMFVCQVYDYQKIPVLEVAGGCIGEKMSKFLINESPLVFQPTLAVMLGINEAIILQQIQYWISNPKAGIWHDGYKWVFNTYENWQEENFPFWSVDGIKKMFLRLEETGVLVSQQLSENKWDKTKYYRIDYEKLEELLQPSGFEIPDDGVPKSPSTITETTREYGEESPGLSIENKIYAGLPVNKTDVGEQVLKQRQQIDSANLIATGTGVNHDLYAAIALAFMRARDIVIPFEDCKGQRKAIKAMVQVGVKPKHVVEAVESLLSSKKHMTITNLFSVKQTAIDLANQPDENDHFLEGV